MGERFRAAIVGAGRIAGAFATPADGPTTHAAAMRHEGSFDIIAVCDSDRGRAEAVAGKWGGRACDDVTSLLSGAAPDLLVVASPDATHVDVVTAVLESPCRPALIVVEKPPCVNREQLQRLVAAASMSSTRIVVNLSRRFDGLHRQVAAMLAGDPFGALVSARFTYYGGWVHNGIHAVDTLRMLIGDVQLVSSADGAPGYPGDSCRDVVAVSRRWPSARIEFSGVDERVFQLFELELRFADGRLRFEQFGERLITEAVVVNRLGERELQPVRWSIDTDRTPAMLHLYRACAMFLRTRDARAIADAELSTILPTMEFLFDAA